MATVKSDDKQYFAITEEIINENFKSLFMQQPDITQVYYDDPRNSVMMDAELLPPNIKIQTGDGDRPEILFSFR
jgi:hypothetical protein